MTFQDIFKSSFLENIATISILDMVIAMVLAFLLGLFIFFIYKKSYSGVMYSASFGVTLIALSLITTPADYDGGEQHRAVSGHGGRSVHCPVPHRYQGTDGYRFPVLGHCGGYCAGRRPDSAGGIRQHLHRA